MDLKWQVAMISMRMKKFYKKTGRKLQFDAKEPVGFDKTKVECYSCHKTGHFARECRSKGNQDSRRRDAWNTGNKEKDNGRRSGKQEDSKALVTLDGEGVDWTSHSEDEQENYAFMACNSSGSDTEREQLGDASIEIQAYTQALKKVEAQLVAHQQSQLCQMSARDKDGLGYGDQLNKGVLCYENEVLQSVFVSRTTEIENSHVNDRYAEGMHVVPPPMTGIYIPSGPDKEINPVLLGENRKLLLSPQQVVIGDTKDITGTKSPNTIVDQDYPQRALQNKGIVDSGCSRHMIGNKAYLAEYQDFNGGPVAFGGSKGYITGKEAESAQDYFVLPIWSSYTSTVKSSKAMNAGENPNKNHDLKTDEKPIDNEDQVFLDELKSQEKDANDAVEALRKEFAQDTEDLLLQAGAAKASSTNTVNTASTPVSTANSDQDDSEIPALEEIYDNPTAGIFTNASYDDEGAVADFTNLETIMNASPIPTSRINSIHPSTLILGDQKSAVQTRSKVTKSSGAHAFDRSHRIFLAFASYMGFIVYQMDVKSAFLYGKIDEEVYVSQPLEYIQKRVLLTKTLFIKKDKHDIILVQVYVDDIIFGSTKRSWCDEFEALMKSRFQMSSMGELTFFLGLQVKQKEDGIFISQDKYVAEILKKFDFASVKTASTPIETQKPLVKDEEASDVDVHLYRSMIGSLMYLTASRPDIMFAVCACSSDICWKTNLDRKSTTGGCQFLGRRLISWQCKKQTIVATSTTEAEYVAAANCCGQVLWIQNQMLDYGFNFMNTKIYIDNESTICIVKNLVFHSKTKHIAIRHHFIRDAYEKKLIQVLKIHTDDNVADLLTKAFDVSIFQFLVVTIRYESSHNSIHYALIVSPIVSTTFVEQFCMSAKSKLINNVKYITAKVAGKPVSISEASIRSDLLFVDADGIDSLTNINSYIGCYSLTWGLSAATRVCANHGGLSPITYQSHDQNKRLEGTESIKLKEENAKPVTHHHKEGDEEFLHEAKDSGRREQKNSENHLRTRNSDSERRAFVYPNRRGEETVSQVPKLQSHLIVSIFEMTLDYDCNRLNNGEDLRNCSQICGRNSETTANSSYMPQEEESSSSLWKKRAKNSFKKQLQRQEQKVTLRRIKEQAAIKHNTELFLQELTLRSLQIVESNKMKERLRDRMIRMQKNHSRAEEINRMRVLLRNTAIERNDTTKSLLSRCDKSTGATEKENACDKKDDCHRQKDKEPTTEC
ncbi:putative ribonuclease H-like domain-containing protein [Tanacetum coccineum]|uniref:Ribonuclease H-like domain-containing protein n=1 Tax=Tanacetum coccineum TaxID=301880 RepID=A0ABQ5G0A2_9ASTR